MLDATFPKSHRDALACPIAHLINLSVRQNTFPSTWKIAVVFPIHKSGDKTMVSNYRPISVLSVISQVSEKWVAEQLKSHLNLGHNPLHPTQFGFCTNHSQRQRTASSLKFKIRWGWCSRCSVFGP